MTETGKSTVGPTFSPSTRSNWAKTLMPASAAADSAAAAASAAMVAASAARARFPFLGKRVAMLIQPTHRGGNCVKDALRFNSTSYSCTETPKARLSPGQKQTQPNKLPAAAAAEVCT